MSTEQAQKTGSQTTEWKGSVIAMVINLAIGIGSGFLSRWGISIDPEILISAILANTGIAGSYTAGRSFIKGKAIPAP
jgi:hypothetical protein